MSDSEEEQRKAYPADLPQPEVTNERDPYPWRATARTRKVEAGWQLLLHEAPENTSECYRYLSFLRVFYVPHEDTKTVDVYYAGRHPKGKAPLP